jgi:glycosyltransferase involved in cell wall biosynthesis
MKLIIQIPCYNEAETLGITLRELPRRVEGFDAVEWLIIDDGCTDNTVEVARAHGVDHIFSLRRNQGLARGFMAGLETCLKLGADVIVNTDADNQYNAKDIQGLVAPIREGRADIVIGTRPIADIDHFSPAKKFLQKLGSWVVRAVSDTEIDDAPSGFRAISREAALRLNVFSEYTYTLETIIQAGQKKMAITSVPISVNGHLRSSRLVKSLSSYVVRSVFTIIRTFVVYNPFRFFMTLGWALFAGGFLVGVRFLFFYFTGDGGGHIQSLVLSSILLGMGFQGTLFAFIVDLLAVNRKLLEENQYKLRKIECPRADGRHG